MINKNCFSLTFSFLMFFSNFSSIYSISELPQTTRTIKAYDESFLSVTGYASVNNAINDRSSYIGTSYYKTANNEREFLEGIRLASKGQVKVIEVTNNLNLGYLELNLSSDEKSKYSFISKYENPTAGFTNPVLQSSGASKLNIGNINGLTVFSTKGYTIKHVEFKLQASANDIVFRNLNFDDMWQWDDAGSHKEVGWTFFKVNGANNVWIDHCSFSIGADGMCDIENGSSGVTFSWCSFGLEATENPNTNGMLYKTMNNMESKYNAGSLSSSSLYYQMRKSGATLKQIMAYTAYHSKVHLVGSGDKDFVNYVDGNGNEVKDGNQRLRLTLAYSKYYNVGQRVPMIRQGSGHVFNIMIDNSSHSSALKNLPSSCPKTETLARAMNPRNGGSIGVDTCIFKGVNGVMIGTEQQGQDTSNMNAPWGEIFKNAYNHGLVVNSKVTNDYGTYTGSSWDNNGDNLFMRDWSWKDKATINNWCWSSSIKGVENMSKSVTPTTPFEFIYNYSEQLPYTYNVIPLDSLESVLNSYAGAGKISLGVDGWLKTKYGSGDSTGIAGLYRIINVNSGKYLGVDGTTSGAHVIQTSTATIWNMIDLGDNWVQLSPSTALGMVIDLPGASKDDSVEMQLWGNTKGDHQQLYLQDNGDGTYAFLTKTTNKAKGLDVMKHSTDDGASVIQYTYKGLNNQKWKLERL